MIFWKEWRELRGRFLALAAFYLITVLLVDIISSVGATAPIIFAPLIVVAWGAGLLLVPAVLGMDVYAGERDEGTEVFLFSKPLSPVRMIIAKIGTRMVLTLGLCGLVMLMVLLRTRAITGTLYFWVRPYVMIYIVLAVLVALLVVLMVTMAVSVRAPYQSTALILGGAFGTAVAAMPVVFSFAPISALQAPWGNLGLLLILLILTSFLACWGLANQEAGRSQS